MSDDDSTQLLEYDDLDEELKDKIRDHARNVTDYLPDNWYEDELDYLIEKYGDQIEIDRGSITFDMYHNDFDWAGTVNLKSEANKKFIPKQFYVYDKDELIYDINMDFKNAEMNRDFTVDVNMIYTIVEDDIFGRQKDNFTFENGSHEVDISICHPKLKEAIKKYSRFNDRYVDSVLEKWMGAIDAAEIFFQNTFLVAEDDYKGVIDALGYAYEQEIEEFMNGEFYGTLDDFVSNLYDEYVRKIKELYDYHFSDEYIDSNMVGLQFRVIVDEDGNQLDVEDLNGE